MNKLDIVKDVDGSHKTYEILFSFKLIHPFVDHANDAIFLIKSS